MLIALDDQVIGRKRIEVMHIGVERYLGCRKLRTLDKFADNIDMTVVDMGVGDHMQQLAGNHIDRLRNHHQQDGVLAHIPVVRGQNVLAALVENHVERRLVVLRALRDVIGHAVRARIQVHLGQVAKHIRVGHDAATVRCVLKIVQHSVHLVEIALGIMALLANLVPVGLADGAGLVGPLIPNMAVEVMDVIGLLLIDPQNLVHRRLKRRAAQGERRELLAQVVARRNAKVFNGIGRGAVLPHRADLLALGGGAMVQDIAAHGYKLLISFAH